MSSQDGNNHYRWFTLQTVAGHASGHCPFQDRMGGLCWGFQGQQGKGRRKSLRYDGCARRSVGIEVRGMEPDNTSPRLSRGTNVLIDQENGNVLSLLCEVLESLLNLRRLRLGIDDQEVTLCICAFSDMLSM